jgi:hypothetical protein
MQEGDPTDHRGIVVYDIDDTLADFSGEFCRHMAAKYKDDSMLDDWKRWGGASLGDFYAHLTDDIVAEFIQMEDEDRFLKMPVKKDIFNTLLYWFERDYEIQLLTARGYMRDGKGQTEEWLRRNKIPYHVLKVCGLRECKSTFIPRGTHAFYDDNHRHMTACAPYVDMAFIIDHPCNRHVSFPRNVMRLATV